MGFNKSLIKLLIRENKNRKFDSPVLTLGRQCVYASVSDLRKIFLQEGQQCSHLPSELSLGTNIPNWEEGIKKNYTSDIVFFKLLGVKESYAADISHYEKPDFILDLNEPVPSNLKNRFGLIIDGGTMEHIFDIRKVLQNLTEMLKVGGRIIHLNPASNYIEHSLYQFSPGFYFGYYSANRFTSTKCYIMEILGNPATTQIKLYKTEGPNCNRPFLSSKKLCIFFCATKSENSTFNETPYQDVKGAHDENFHGEEKLKFQGVKKYIPLFLWKFVRRIIYWKYRKRDKCYKYVGKV